MFLEKVSHRGWKGAALAKSRRRQFPCKGTAESFPEGRKAVAKQASLGKGCCDPGAGREGERVAWGLGGAWESAQQQGHSRLR